MGRSAAVHRRDGTDVVPKSPLRTGRGLADALASLDATQPYEGGLAMNPWNSGISAVWVVD